MAKITHEIHVANTDEEIKALFPFYKILGPHVPSADELLQMVRIIQGEGAHFLYIKDTIEGETEPRVVSILSYRLQHSLFYYRQMCLYDICTLTNAKKKGYAGALMDRAIEIAKQEKCNVATLDSSYVRSRTDAQRLYMNKGFYTKGHHFCLDIDPKGK